MLLQTPMFDYIAGIAVKRYLKSAEFSLALQFRLLYSFVVFLRHIFGLRAAGAGNTTGSILARVPRVVFFIPFSFLAS